MNTSRYLAREAAADPKVGQFILAAAGALKSPDPAASLEWLASVEQDDDLRFGFARAAELVRARRGADTS